MQPAKGSTRVLVVRNRNAAHKSPNGCALSEGDEQGTYEEAGIPKWAHTPTSIAKLERNSAKYQSNQHQ